MRKLLFLFALICSVVCHAQQKNVIRLSVVPEEAAIYINNNLAGYGYAEFSKPKKKEVVVIKIECAEYNTIYTKFYGSDKRTLISYTMQQDGFFRSSAASGIVNKFFTINIDPQYYTIDDDKIDVSKAWKMLHQILLNYFDEIATTDYDGGYVQTTWQYKQFNLTEKQIRNRVTIRDISTPSKVAFQIKIDSEVASGQAAKHGEFEPVDRIPKEFETIIQELQTRIGKVYNL